MITRIMYRIYPGEGDVTSTNVVRFDQCKVSKNKSFKVKYISGGCLPLRIIDRFAVPFVIPLDSLQRASDHTHPPDLLQSYRPIH